MLLRRRQASEHQKETRDGRDGVALACHLRVLCWFVRCSPLEGDSLLNAIPSYCLEINIWWWVENDHINPKTQKRKSTRNGYPDLTDHACVRNIRIFNYH